MWSPLLFKFQGFFLSPSICFSPDGDTLAVASDDRIDLYDASNGLLNGNIAILREGGYLYGPLQAIFTADGFKVFVLSQRHRYDHEGMEY